MRSFQAVALFGALAVANPYPQLIDLDMVIAAPRSTVTPAVGGTGQSVTYNTASIQAQATAVSSVSIVTSEVLPATTPAAIHKRGNCETQPAGATGAPKTKLDSAPAFRSNAGFASAASAAPVPSGYSQTFKNLNGSNNAYGYLGYSTLQTYDSVECANRCNKINGCMAVNIYFERDPSVNPGAACQNPCGVTYIKCAYWGAPVDSSNAVNTGQWREKFEVAIAGSNGYVNNSIATPAGYTGPTYLGNKAINALYDSQGYMTYMGATVFTSGAYNVALCATYCSHQSQYNLAHPPTDGSPVQTCQFFNTYILYINQTSNTQGQYCAIYSEAWPASKATNDGQFRGSDHYLIEYSYSFVNTTNPGAPNKQGAIYQAKKEITTSSLQPYCSSLLGYTTPTVTATALSTTTPLTTVTTTSTLSPQIDVSVITVMSTVTTTSTVTTLSSTTSTTYTYHAKRSVAPVISDGKLVVATEDYPDRMLPTALASSLLAAGNLSKRATATAAASVPSVLSKYPSTVVQSACSLVATPVTVIYTTTTSITQIAPTSTVTVSTSTQLQTTILTSTTAILTQTITATTTQTVTTTVTNPGPYASFAYDRSNDCGCAYGGYNGVRSGFYCTFVGNGNTYTDCAKSCDFFGNCYHFSLTGGTCYLCTADGNFDPNANGISGSRLAGSCKDGTCEAP